MFIVYKLTTLILDAVMDPIVMLSVAVNCSDDEINAGLFATFAKVTYDAVSAVFTYDAVYAYDIVTWLDPEIKPAGSCADDEYTPEPLRICADPDINVGLFAMPEKSTYDAVAAWSEYDAVSGTFDAYDAVNAYEDELENDELTAWEAVIAYDAVNGTFDAYDAVTA